MVITFIGAQWLSDPQSTKSSNTHRCIVSEATHSRSKLVLFGSISVEGHMSLRKCNCCLSMASEEDKGDLIAG